MSNSNSPRTRPAAAQEPTLRDQSADLKAGLVRAGRARRPAQVTDQPEPASLPRESAADRRADVSPISGPDPQDAGRGHPDDGGRADAARGPAPHGEHDMGRHETFENAAPIAAELLTSTILGRAPHPNFVARADAMRTRADVALADHRISRALRSAIEAHRDASVAMLLCRDDSDEAFNATTSAVEVTEAALRAVPAGSAVDLHRKLAFMLPDLLEEVNCVTTADYLRSICEDAARLASAPRSLPPVEVLADAIDFEAQTLARLVTINDVAELVSDVASAVAQQPRCTEEDADHTGNAAGDLLDWMTEACDWVLQAARDEARARKPSNHCDRDRRLEIIARADIENGDLDQTWALARDVAVIATDMGAR